MPLYRCITPFLTSGSSFALPLCLQAVQESKEEKYDEGDGEEWIPEEEGEEEKEMGDAEGEADEKEEVEVMDLLDDLDAEPDGEGADENAQYMAVLNLCLLRLVQLTKMSRRHTDILLSLFRLVLKRFAGPDISDQVSHNHYALVKKKIQPIVDKEWQKIVICPKCSSGYRCVSRTAILGMHTLFCPTQFNSLSNRECF